MRNKERGKIYGSLIATACPAKLVALACITADEQNYMDNYPGNLSRAVHGLARASNSGEERNLWANIHSTISHQEGVPEVVLTEQMENKIDQWIQNKQPLHS